jgi:large subunit ribosomal protein L4
MGSQTDASGASAAAGIQPNLGLLGRKVGMMRIFSEDGESIPVTVIDVSNNRVSQVKTAATDGYDAIQVVYGERRPTRVNKALAGHLGKAGVQAGSAMKEFHVSAEKAGELKPGTVLGADLFVPGQYIDVQGVSQGKGFAGTIKRHNFSSNRASHGNSRSHNVPGSIGMAQDPGRVFPGKKMSGQMGNVTRTVQNLVVARVDAERGFARRRRGGDAGGQAPAQPDQGCRREGRGRQGRRRQGRQTGRQERLRRGSFDMELKLLNDQGQSAGTVDAVDTVFGRDFNEPLVHQIVVAYQANARSANRAQKDRSEVRHSTKKPWRQKGTGRARAGMTSSPLWRGGGRIFPNKPDENFSQKVNKKMYRAGMCSILSQLAREDRLAVVDPIELDAPKTKLLATRLRAMGLTSTLILTDSLDENLLLAARNLPNVLVLEAKHADPLSLVHYGKVLITRPALSQVQEMLG